MGDSAWNQVEICAKIGIECMDADPNKRPNIQRILDKLGETGSTDGFTEAVQVRLLKAYAQQYLHFYKLVYIAAY